MNPYMKILWDSWKSTPVPHMEWITCDRDALMRKAQETQDGGETVAWIASIASIASGKWIGVRDKQYGHEIHCISDRRVPRSDLILGLQLMAWMSRHTPLRWFWWDHSWPRILPSAVDPGRDHVNGGWAIIGVPEIHVYRREEAHKVLLHECIHALGLDVSMDAATVARQQFEAALGRRLWPHLGEAWTELRAEMLWAVCRGRSWPNACQLWQKQKECSHRQAAQVWVRIRDSREAEDTNVFAYYVLKWVLMEHEEEVMVAPTASVAHWFRWWREQLPALNAAASLPVALASERATLAMGMTCAAS